MSDKNDPLGELGAAIEKARGMIPGGSRGAAKRAFAFARVGTKVSGALRSDKPAARASRAKMSRRLNAAVYLEARGGLRQGYRRSWREGSSIYGGRKGVYKSDIHKAKPKTLYVYRPVENAEDIIAWAKSQGFATTQPADKLHVTLAFSKTPLNWANLHDDYRLEPSEYASSCGCDGPVLRSADGGQNRRKIQGGVREVKALGTDGAVVLAFESDSLTQRWMDFKRAGAVWSFPSFTPHISLTYDGGSVDLSKVHPYAGDIILGEECWEEVNPSGQAEAIAAEKTVSKALETIEQRLTKLETPAEAA